MKFSVIVPAHNEEAIIGKTIAELIKAVKNYDCEIIAINDNSNDSTGKILESLSKKYKRLKVLHKLAFKQGPTGLGTVLIFGFKSAKGKILVPFMGDLSDNPDDIVKLVKKVEEGYDVVCGSRFIKGGKIKDYPLIKLIMNRLWNNLFAFLFRMKVKDISNAFKAYKKEVIDKTKPKSKGFEITAEVVLKAYIMGLKITEVPVSWSGRKRGYGESKFGSFTSKILLVQIPRIGYSYGMLALKLWFKFLFKSVTRIFKF